MSYIGSTPTTQSFIAGTDYFNGTGSAVNFTMSRSVNSVNDIEVIVNNVEQIPSGYSVSGTTLTFSVAPSSGTSNVYVRYLSTTLLSVAPTQGSSMQFGIGSAALPSISFTGDTNTGIFSPAADTIAFAEGGVEAMRLNASGNLQTIGTISVGNATPSTSGAGITFPATQSASSNANTLDDYEEGTWTPVLSGAGSITTQTGSGTYQKIGSRVYLTGVILVSNVGTVSGGGTVSGLPFTNSVQFSGCGAESAVNGKSLAIRQATTGATSYDMNYYDNSGSCNGITNGTNFIFSVYYQTSQ